jgi:carnitine O-acetyltransferase
VQSGFPILVHIQESGSLFQDYLELRSKTRNSHILDAIHSSAFIICLDSSMPRGSIRHSRALWHGDVDDDGIPVGLRNRWVDKPLQFIVFDNGYAGLMGEHSVMDGTPTARMCNNVLDMLYDPAFDHGKPSGEPIPSPQPLDWEISPEITQAITNADHAARELVEGQELGFHITAYGKSAIKAFGVSPDSWAQMIIHLAYKRLLGNNKRNGATYEAASARKFYKGRTETIRVVTSEADTWANSMDDDKVNAKTRKDLFDLATSQHISLAVNAGQGQGVDRHLFGWNFSFHSIQATSLTFLDDQVLEIS